MPRWLFILAIAVITWFALTAHETGLTQRTWDSATSTELPEWKPPAEHAASDRPEDAFQRAWNSTEKRTREALRAEGGAD